MSDMSSQHAYFDVEPVDDALIVRFKVQRLTEELNLEEMGHELFSLVENDDKRRIVLQLTGVDYATSSVLGKFITLHRKLHRLQGRLVVCDMTPSMREVLRTSRLLDYFNTVDNLAAARAAMMI